MYQCVQLSERWNRTGCRNTTAVQKWTTPLRRVPTVGGEKRRFSFWKCFFLVRFALFFEMRGQPQSRGSMHTKLVMAEVVAAMMVCLQCTAGIKITQRNIAEIVCCHAACAYRIFFAYNRNITNMNAGALQWTREVSVGHTGRVDSKLGLVFRVSIRGYTDR